MMAILRIVWVTVWFFLLLYLAAQGLRLGAKIKQCTAQCGNIYCISREEKQAFMLGIQFETGRNQPPKPPFSDCSARFEVEQFQGCCHGGRMNSHGFFLKKKPLPECLLHHINPEML
jgi:hypothetical protein